MHKDVVDIRIQDGSAGPKHADALVQWDFVYLDFTQYSKYVNIVDINLPKMLENFPICIMWYFNDMLPGLTEWLQYI